MGEKQTPNNQQHQGLCDLGARWLRAYNNFIFVDTEVHSPQRQVPDVIGLGFGISAMIECKTSRSDFMADRKKPHYNSTVGKHRFYLCPPNIIKPDDLDKGWGLLYAHGKTVKSIEPIVGATHRMVESWGLTSKENLWINYTDDAKNPNRNEYVEYQIALKAMKEHKVRRMPVK